MISLVRSGPKVLVLESRSINNLKNYIKDSFYCLELDINDALEKATETSTVILMTKEMKEIVKKSDIEDVLVVNDFSDNILSRLFNEKRYELISKLRIAPRIIIMKTFGDTEKIISEIQNDYNGTLGKFEKLLEKNNSGTVVAFTENNLNNSLSLQNVYHKSLYIDESFPKLIKELKIHGLRYLNMGLEKKEWYELKIKIYDSYGEYSLHYERLVKVIEQLDLGLVLGEKWGTDAALIFLSVGTYTIRFFTFYEPEYVKKVLLGLEHLEDGSRIVDIDIYYKRRKLHWSDLKDRGSSSREELGKKYRQEIFSRLNEECINEIIEIENIIEKKK